jgi:hypothetical protein
MPGTIAARGNELYDFLVAPTALVWSTTTLGATTTSELTATVAGVQVGDYIGLQLFSGPITTGLSILNERVSAANTIAIQWSNSTGGGLAIPTTGWVINIVRPEAYGLLPTSAA